MRHFYLRLIFGIIWMVSAFVSAMGANGYLAVTYAALGIMFLGAARSIRKGGRGQRK